MLHGAVMLPKAPTHALSSAEYWSDLLDASAGVSFDRQVYLAERVGKLPDFMLGCFVFIEESSACQSAGHQKGCIDRRQL